MNRREFLKASAAAMFAPAILKAQPKQPKLPEHPEIYYEYMYHGPAAVKRPRMRNPVGHYVVIDFQGRRLGEQKLIGTCKGSLWPANLPGYWAVDRPDVKLFYHVEFYEIVYGSKTVHFPSCLNSWYVSRDQIISVGPYYDRPFDFDELRNWVVKQERYFISAVQIEPLGTVQPLTQHGTVGLRYCEHAVAMTLV